MGSQQENFALRWNDFHANISSAFKHLRSTDEFQDVTLCCGPDSDIKAHKVILSACSPYFQAILKTASKSSPHPVILMPQDVQYEELTSLIDFMYYGEVEVPENDLSRFLSVAEQFQVRGLVENVPKVGAPSASGAARKRPRQEEEEGSGSYQPLPPGSHQPVGLVCPRCRIICRDGPDGLRAHQAVCGQEERPVLQVAPSRQRGGSQASLASRPRARQVSKPSLARGGQPALRGRGGGRARGGARAGAGAGPSRHSSDLIKSSQVSSQGSLAAPRPAPVAPVVPAENKPNLELLGQKLGHSVSISLTGQKSQPDSQEQPEIKQEPPSGDLEDPAETEDERDYPEFEGEDTEYENQFEEAYDGAGDLAAEYLEDGEVYPDLSGL